MSRESRTVLMVPKNSKPGAVRCRPARGSTHPPTPTPHTDTTPCWWRRRCQHLSGSLASTVPAGSHAQYGARGTTPGCWQKLLLLSGWVKSFKVRGVSRGKITAQCLCVQKLKDPCCVQPPDHILSVNCAACDIHTVIVYAEINDCIQNPG